MIKETTRKINFATYEVRKGQKKDDSGPVYASVDVKYGIIRFSAEAVREMGMIGKFLRFYHEADKKIIGWRLVDSLSESEFKSKNYRPIIVDKSTNQCKTSVSGLIREFRNLEPRSYKCEIRKYRETSDMLSKGEVYFYIRLNNEKDDTETDR